MAIIEKTLLPCDTSMQSGHAVFKLFAGHLNFHPDTCIPEFDKVLFQIQGRTGSLPNFSRKRVEHIPIAYEFTRRNSVL